MLDLYEQNRRVASISFSEMLDEFGVRRFWEIQNILGRKIVFVRSDSTIDSTLRADGGRVDGKQHHSRARQVPSQGGEEAGTSNTALASGMGQKQARKSTRVAGQ